MKKIKKIDNTLENNDNFSGRGAVAPGIMLPLAVTIVGMLASILIFTLINRIKFQQWETVFINEAQRNVYQFKKIIDTNKLILQGIGGLFYASEFVGRAEFENYVNNILKHVPFIGGIGWIPAVSDRMRGTFEAELKTLYGADMFIKKRNETGAWERVETRETYFPVKYFEPANGRNILIGFDYLSDSARRKALERAIAEGEVMTTEKTVLAGGDFKAKAGLVCMTPVYEGGCAPRDAGLRREKVMGLVSCAFGIEELFSSLALPFETNEINFVIASCDKTGANEVYGTLKHDWPLKFESQINAFGHEWKLVWQGSSEYAGGPGLEIAWQLASSSFILSMLVVIIVILYQNYTARIEFEVKERTAELSNANIDLKKEVNERLLTEEKLRLTNEKIKNIVENINAGFVTLNFNWCFSYVNPTAEKYLKKSAGELKGNDLWDIFPETSEKKFRSELGKVMDQKVSVKFEEFHSVLNKWFEINAYPVAEGISIFFDDITLRKRSEEELLKICKLESINILAGTVAHDFNNFLTAIIGNIEIVRCNCQNNKRVIEVLARIEEASFSARELTNQLLTLSRESRPLKKVVNIVEPVKNSTLFAVRGFKANCEFNIAKGVHKVKADVNQIGQAITNIVLNAVQAMNENGTINVSVDNAERDENDYLLPAGKYVRISIKDSGIGIPPENLSKIFDPYFTTKSKGTGLGLPSVYSIIKGHDGFIDVESRENIGTTFNIYIPAFLEEA